MSRLDDLMAGTMSHQASARGLLGEELTLYNYTDENTDPTDAPDWQLDNGTAIEGHIDWQSGEPVIEETVGGEVVRGDAQLFIPSQYDVRDGRNTGERASVVEGPDGNEFRVQRSVVESGNHVCVAVLRDTPTNG